MPPDDHTGHERDRRVNDAIADEMLDRLERSRDLAVVHHTVQVTSFGGSGTTALADHLLAAGVDLPTTPGFFPFKHQRVPPRAAAVPAGFRVVYPFGDPRNAVVSVFRRGFQGGHYRGMQLRRPVPEVEQRLVSLETFLDAGIDDFGIEDHFDHWFNRSERGFPVLFVRFDDLPHAWPVLADFVSLPRDAPGLAVRGRASEWQSLPPLLRSRIDEMFGPLARRLLQLAPTELR
jgi:hypothetical protein